MCAGMQNSADREKQHPAGSVADKGNAVLSGRPILAQGKRFSQYLSPLHERQKKPASPYIFFIHMDYTADDNPGISVHFTVQKDMGAFFILAHAASQTFC